MRWPIRYIRRFIVASDGTIEVEEVRVLAFYDYV